MINEEKIKIMTKLASYEEHLGKQDFEVIKRMKSDYVSSKSFTTCIFVTIALLIVFAADFGTKFIDNMATFTSDFDLVSEGFNYLAIWIFVMVVYSFISGRAYRREYDVAKQRVKVYEQQLNELEKFSRNK